MSEAGSEKSGPTLEEELAHLGLLKDASEIRSLFDDYFESSVVGSRKPEAAFYQHALRKLGVEAGETIFLDDIGHNLKAAQALGIRTIRVGLKDSTPALQELERHTGCRLIGHEVENGDVVDRMSKASSSAKL